MLTFQLTELVQREVLRESAVEDQTSVLSYFIQTAKVNYKQHTVVCIYHLRGNYVVDGFCMQSCLDLKNYEAVFSIVAGLESKSILQVAHSWQVR